MRRYNIIVEIALHYLAIIWNRTSVAARGPFVDEFTRNVFRSSE